MSKTLTQRYSKTSKRCMYGNRRIVGGWIYSYIFFLSAESWLLTQFLLSLNAFVKLCDANQIGINVNSGQEDIEYCQQERLLHLLDLIVNIFFFRSCPTCNMDRGRIYNCRWHLSIVPKNITDKGIRNIWYLKKSIGTGLV